MADDEATLYAFGERWGPERNVPDESSASGLDAH
jgi:hypothetical protein